MIAFVTSGSNRSEHAARNGGAARLTVIYRKQCLVETLGRGDATNRARALSSKVIVDSTWASG